MKGAALINPVQAAASFDNVEAMVDHRLRRIAAREATFAAKVGAVLEEVVRLSRNDPYRSALFGLRRDTFLPTLVDEAIDAGLAEPADREIVIDTLVAVIVGLVAAGSAVPAVQAKAVQGLKRLFRGDVMTKCR
jgi:hypothetical protein